MGLIVKYKFLDVCICTVCICTVCICTVSVCTMYRCEANGKWSRGRTECKIIECPTPRSPAGGKVSGYNFQVHRKVSKLYNSFNSSIIF